MNLLYVASLHPLQNSDHILTFNKLGINWVDTGYYSISESPKYLHNIKRTNTDLYEELESQEHKLFPDDECHTFNGMKNKLWTGVQGSNKWIFSKSFIDKFDVIVFNHFPENIENNIGVLKGKLVIMCTYGMQGQINEKKIRQLRRRYGIKVVRNSPVEDRLFTFQYAGHDAIIRGSVVKDENELSGWIGNKKEVCTFSSFFDADDMKCKGRKKHYTDIKERLHDDLKVKNKDVLNARFNGPRFPMRLFGVQNNKYDPKANFISHEEKIKILQDCRVNLVVGTPNSTNTYSFVEAWVMGQPVVAFNKDMWQSTTCEMEELIDQGKTGFYCKNEDEACQFIRLLMDDSKLAMSISEESRKKAVSIFGREVISNQWKEFFKSCGLSL